jgi:phenylpyruvate tautomerase PptA (4-oxalocrotonate tautomerase family)
MPYLQLDIPRRYPTEVKRRLAQQLGALFALQMQTTQHKVAVAFRELPGGSLWRCGETTVGPAAVISCDIRRGRSPQQRAQLAESLVRACAEALDLDPDCFSVQFTQHAGDEIFRIEQGLGADWTPTESEAAGAATRESGC